MQHAFAVHHACRGQASTCCTPFMLPCMRVCGPSHLLPNSLVSHMTSDTHLTNCFPSQKSVMDRGLIAVSSWTRCSPPIPEHDGDQSWEWICLPKGGGGLESVSFLPLASHGGLGNSLGHAPHAGLANGQSGRQGESVTSAGSLVAPLTTHIL